jgi:serine/threonine protein phosphatase PrpC
MVEDPQVLEIVTHAPSLEVAVSGLVDAANHAGGTDNVTVLALQCLAGGG